LLPTYTQPEWLATTQMRIKKIKESSPTFFLEIGLLWDLKKRRENAKTDRTRLENTIRKRKNKKKRKEKKVTRKEE
jgi:hypothetical protein